MQDKKDLKHVGVYESNGIIVVVEEKAQLTREFNINHIS